VNAVRNMSLLLRPSMLDDLGLVPALEWQVRGVSQRPRLLGHLVEGDGSDALSEEDNNCLYRLVEEGVYNCLRRPGAPRRKNFRPPGSQVAPADDRGRRQRL